ncbi:MAG: glutamine--fructose-6-phosphate transaminase (isomerizing) [Alphaproteobacteria bacterium]|nr:glutamine--fructose-6-phosphate transaminase (isomerizing) [Alphaproteobacteria bacterium]
MCGIVGVIGNGAAAPLLLDGLKRLEYRGYDSAGIATLVNGHIDRRRAEGKLANLERVLAERPMTGEVGIGHTRWATHGVPNERNAHPHATARVAVVHNGIIENFQELKAELVGRGHNFESDTDTEVIAQLISHYLAAGQKPIEATAATLKRLDGAFALALIFAGEANLMIGARRGSPLAVGWGEGEMYLGSDALALAPLTQRITYLEDGDWAVLTRTGAEVRDEADRAVERPIRTTAISGALTGKGGYRHYMEKEIWEQPTVIGETLKAYYDPLDRGIALPKLPFDPAKISRLTIAACGTAYYAAMIARYWFERLARLPADGDIASEFRYRAVPLPKDGAALFISQSGETADTLAALRFARSQGQPIAAIVNVAESTIARESDIVLRTHAGPEIGVASTKAFTCQLATLACLAVAFAAVRRAIDPALEAKLTAALTEVPSRAADVLNHDPGLRAIAAWLAEARDVLYVGRGTSYALAMEGALKLKEISYIHAEGYAAGELKHGPIALVDEATPVIVIAPSDELFDKTASNMQEIVARGAKVVLLSDARGIKALGDKAHATVELPAVHPLVAPLLYAIPVQLLAYHVAVHKGTDLDQPRNLAKSVTVE